jgi:hypothetical protein
MYVSKAAMHYLLNTPSGTLVFPCDMIFNIPFIADLQALQRYRLLCTNIFAVIFIAVGILFMKLETP